MNTARKLRLGPLPKTESINSRLGPASLKADLDRYAAFHAQTYGEADLPLGQLRRGYSCQEYWWAVY